MGLRIRTNVPALVAQRHLFTSRGFMDKAYERISSGYRINHAGDDAAGLANSETLRAQIRGLSQAQRNAQDGISLIQVAEGGLSEIANLLIRLRELSVQAASDTLGTQERSFVNIEFQQLVEEIDRIAQTTQFNRVPLLNGSSNHFEIQVGLGNNAKTDRIEIYDSKIADVTSQALGISLLNTETKINAQLSLEPLDDSIAKVTGIRAQFGAMQNRLQSSIQNISISRENLSSAESRIRDADMAEESTELSKQQILMQSGIAILGQANQSSQAALSLLNPGG